MNYAALSVTAKELGDVLGLTDRRIRQLAEEGVFDRVARGKYPLAASVQTYIAALESDESDELRRERIALMKAQRRRIELDNELREGTEQDYAFQDTMIYAVSIWWLLHVRPIATWLFEELRGRSVKDPEVIAGAVQNWLIALRAEGEEKMKEAAAAARRKGIIIASCDDLWRLMGKGGGLEGEYEPEEGNE